MGNTTANEHWKNLSKQDQQHTERIAAHLDANPHHSQAMNRHCRNQDHQSATEHIFKIGKELALPGLTIGSAAGIAWYFLKLA